MAEKPAAHEHPELRRKGALLLVNIETTAFLKYNI